ncbi:MAG: hypothetical protein ACKVG0_10960 [Alphaproteobacteria bacterium]
MDKMECSMDQGITEQKSHYGFSALEKEEVWDRWARGESLKAIGRAFGKLSGVSAHGTA